MNGKLLVCVLAGVSMALMADAEPFEAEEVWSCGDSIRLAIGDMNSEVVVASVTISGREIPAVFSLEGLKLTWRFGDDFFFGDKAEAVRDILREHGLNSSMLGSYAIVIEASSGPLGHAGRYYDFTHAEEGVSVPPSQAFFCEKE